MTTINDEVGAALSRRIRLERETRGWSQAQLADASGVSKATVSKIERDEMSPTASTLVRIAGAFGLTLAGLLLKAENDSGNLSPVHAQVVWRDPDSGYTRQQVFMHPAHPVELVRVTLPAGASVTMPEASYAHIRQVVWVLEGQLNLHEGGQHHELNQGDALGFGAPSDVTFTNSSERECVYTVALARQ
ncbi:helix-turn-helix domain-containing protein [Deinococcus antarcticus]|uniref:Helix-turn-helix domain-containing protein n=1 Tax=Deinococcus antarcticus TaxID=1298767 RepID=A0ABV8A6B0_9DEIO